VDFIRLNELWIQKYFALEETDLKYLHDPITNIISPGGDIVFLLDQASPEEDRVVGTCALIPHEHGVFELAKMAVDEDERGRGLGNILMEAVIECAHDKKAHRIFLLSNTVLVPALSLYKKYGFQIVSLGPHPDYERADIEMALELEPLKAD